MSGRGKRLAANLVIVLFLYANAAVILRPVLRRFAPPLPSVIHDAFHVFGVFSTYETVNREVIVEGLTDTVRGGVHHFEWRRFDDSEYFPFRRGEKYSRLYAHRNVGNLAPRTFVEAQRILAAKIKARYNREHPGQPFLRLRIRVLTWPRSLAGYEAERKPGTEELVTWLAE